MRYPGHTGGPCPPPETLSESDSDMTSNEAVQSSPTIPETMRAAVLQGFATATDLADYLVKKGLPFRDSHEAVAQAVRHAEQAGCGLEDLPLTVLQGFSALIENDVYQVLT